MQRQLPLQSIHPPSYRGYFDYGDIEGQRHRIEFDGNPTANDLHAALDREHARLAAHPQRPRLASVPITNLSNWMAMRAVHVAAGLEAVRFVQVDEHNFKQFATLEATGDTFAHCLLLAKFSAKQRLVGILWQSEPVGVMRFELGCVATRPRYQAMLHSLLIDAKHQNRGLGTAAAFLFLVYTFIYHTAISYAEVRVAPDNKRAIAAYRTAGFGEPEEIGGDSGLLCMRASRDFKVNGPVVIQKKK